jgi:dihydroceramidase
MYVLVGIGSLAFHATLLYEAQLADELPMIFGASYSTLLLFDTEPEPSPASRSGRSTLIITIIIIFDLLFSWS